MSLPSFFKLYLYQVGQRLSLILVLQLLKKTTRLLDEIRDPVKSKIIANYPSFQNKNCDAEFSDIFSSNLFKNLSQVERNFFETSITGVGLCSICNIEQDFQSS